MFIGRYYHRLEAKGRLCLPKEFRGQESSWILTRGLEGSLFLLPPSEFEEQLKIIAARTLTKKTQREFVRLLTNDAMAVEVDKLGRIKLPDYLIKQAGLQKQVVIAGSYRYIEIWDQTKYHQHLDQIGDQAETLAEKVTETNL